MNAFLILERIQVLLNSLMPILIGIAVLYFMWGVITYVISGDDQKKKEARMHIINGLIGLFVILSFWGIVAVINNTLGIDRQQLKPNEIPCVPIPSIPGGGC